MRLPKTPKELALCSLVAFGTWAGILWNFGENLWPDPEKPPLWYAGLLVIPIGLLAAAALAWIVQIGVRSAKE